MHHPGNGWSQAYNMKYERDSHAQEAANLQADVNTLRKNYKSWKAYAQKLEQKVELLALKLKVEQCNAEGLFQQVIAMRDAVGEEKWAELQKMWEVANDLPSFQSGNPRKNIEHIYNKGFDEKAKEVDLENPKEYRDRA